MAESLLFKITPYEGESLRGFLLRLSEANLVRNSAWLKDVPGLTEQAQRMVGKSLHGRIPNWLRQSATDRVSPAVIDQRHVLGAKAKFCPACLKEEEFWRLEWEHVFYTVCHRHQLLMIERCPQCAKFLKWNRPNLGKCTCGVHLDEWPAQKAHEPERELCGRLSACIAVDADRPVLPTENFFVAMPRDITTNELANLIFIFGLHGEALPTDRRRAVFNSNASCITHHLVRTAANMLMSWPAGFHTFLQDVGKYGETEALRKNPTRRFLNFMKAVRNGCKTPGLNFVIEAYREFVHENSHGILNRRHNWASTEDIKNQRYVPANAVAVTLGISRKRIRELINQRVLRGYIKSTKKQREFVAVERASIRNAQQYLGDQVTLSGAALLLGIPKNRVDELVTGGLLKQYTGEARRIKARLFSRKEIAEFVKRLSSKSREPLEEEDLIAALGVMKTHLAPGEEFCQLIRDVLSGHLRIVRTLEPKRGITGFAFNREEFYSWRARHRAGTEKVQLTAMEVASELGIKQEVAYHLIRSELLKSHTELLGKRSCRFVHVKDLEKFQTNYISAACLAKKTKTSSKGIVERLRKIGIHAVTGPGIDSCRQYFFLRKKLPIIEFLII